MTTAPKITRRALRESASKSRPALQKWLTADTAKPESRSFFQIPNSVLGHPTLTLNKLQVLLVLAKFADRNGLISTYSRSQETIAEHLGWSKNGLPHHQKVSDIIFELSLDGWVTVIRKDGANPVNHYQLNQLPVAYTLTDRGTPEYLAAAEQKRQEVYRNYDRKYEPIGEAPEESESDYDMSFEELDPAFRFDESDKLNNKIRAYKNTPEFSEEYKKQLASLVSAFYQDTGRRPDMPDLIDLKIQAEFAALEIAGLH